MIEHKVEEILVEMLSSLLKADIAFRCTEIMFSPSHCNGVLDLLKGVCNVKFLSLSCRTLDSLALASDFVAPMFHNLTRLELNFSSSDWHLIPALLESSYNL